MRKTAKLSRKEHIAAAKAINYLRADALELHQSLQGKLTVKELDSWLGKLVKSGVGPDALRSHLDNEWFRAGNGDPSPYYPVWKGNP